MKKCRLDLYLLERKMVSTRTKAQSLIRDGKVTVDGLICLQPGIKVGADAQVALLSAEHPYVSRGGLKLEAALRAFAVPVEGLRALDIGQSTGGFTQCLLLNGAAEVVGVEVGHGQLSPLLRCDARVRCLERQDIRHLPPETLRPAFPVCVGDLSFISLSLIIPFLPPFLAPEAHIVLLVKPQFELGPGSVGSGGIVRDALLRSDAVRKVEECSMRLGFTVAGIMESPIEGGDGNKEFFLHLRWFSS